MQNRKFGALWLKQNDKGEYMTGEITINGRKIRIICFKNRNKTENPKSPDWDILKSAKNEQGLTI